MTEDEPDDYPLPEKKVGGFGKLRAADNPKPWTSENQPATKGRKKTKEITKLVRAFGVSMAPHDLRNNEKIKAFLDENKLRGTVNEVIVAKLFTMFLHHDNLKAFEHILAFMEGNGKLAAPGMTINFIMPKADAQEDTEDLKDDEWTIQPTPTP